jgi:polyisoprenoid-binding protein YceI
MDHRVVRALAALAFVTEVLGAQSAPRGTPGSSAYVIDTAAVEARYRVTERFAANTIDNEVVGTTRGVTGQVVLDIAGRPIAAESRITIDLTGLKTDRTRRDGYVQKNTLETAKWPTALLSVRELRGLPASLPDAGAFDVTLIGDLTLHGVTRSTTWTAKVTVTSGAVRALARTTLLFADFGIPVPKVPLIARVDDPITLEVEVSFHRPADPNDR